MAGSIRLTGDFKELERLIAKVSDPKAALATVSREMCDEALNLINEGFQSETDPDGKPWAPLVAREGKILQLTGGMAASWHRGFAKPSGFRVGAGKSYAKHHQDGTKTKSGGTHIPARKMVPSSGRLPAKWRGRLLDAAREALQLTIGKK